MTPARIRWTALLAALLVLLAGFLALSRRVTVLADGHSYEFATHALTVGGAVKVSGVELGPKDEVEPPPLSLLRDGLIIAVHRAALIQLRADGKYFTVVTAERDPNAILASWHLSLGEDDRLVLAGERVELDHNLPTWPVLSLELRRAVPVTVDDGGDLNQFVSSATTLGQALTEEGIQLELADRVHPSASTPLNSAVDATITRARAMQIKLGNESISLLSAAQTVGDALADAGVSLQGLDRSDPDEDQPVPENGEIRIHRVNETVELVQSPLPHKTEAQPDSDADLGTSSVIQEGYDGVQATRTRVRFEDGQETSRKKDPQRILVEAKTQINGYGTQLVTNTVDVDGITVQYYRSLLVYVTSYSPCGSGISGCSNGTASGMPVERGTIATWVTWYRQIHGCQLYVPGYGYGIIGDTGSYPPDRNRAWIDLAYSDADYVGWSDWVTVYFTSPDSNCNLADLTPPG